MLLVSAPYAPLVMANWTGSLETLGQATSEIRGEKSELTLWGDALYVSDNRETQFHLLLNQQVWDSSETEFYQLYINQHLSNYQSLSFGRFQKSDFSGFYIIDGILYGHAFNENRMHIYAGKPKRLDGFLISEGDLILGLEGFIAAKHFGMFSAASNSTEEPTSDYYTVTHSHRLGLQYQKGADHVTPDLSTQESMKSLNRVAIVSHALIKNNQSSKMARYTQQDIEMNAELNYLASDNALEKLSLEGMFPLASKTQLGLWLKHYAYLESAIDFRGQFYKFLNQGDQTEYLANIYFSPKRHDKHSLEFRFVEREIGEEGRGLALNSYFHGESVSIESRLELLDFMRQDHIGLFLGAKHSTGPFSKVAINTIFRVQQSQLRATSQTYGVELRWDWRPHRTWFLYCSGEFINQEKYDSDYSLSFPDDEYRVSLSLSKNWDTARQ
jgi:hypothetical protein